MPFIERDVRDRNILVVEDVYDTGNALFGMRECLTKMEPK